MGDSEFRTYEYIRSVLETLGWDTRNPERAGQVYTQSEFRRHDDVLTNALGAKTPENIVLVPWDGWFRYWIVEAKRKHRDKKKALEEAKNYANSINKTSPGSARFATGIAGTPDSSFLVSTSFWNGIEWKEVAINNYETTGFLTSEQCQYMLRDNSHHLALFDYNPKRFLDKANGINATLHSNEIPVSERARLMAALLLALAEDGNLRIFPEPTRLINEINGSIEVMLNKHGKIDFKDVMSITLPATDKNHRKYRKAVVDTLQHLREMNIRSAINSGDDALGKFYETFLKYANGAREMGIVLTPRHITKFAVDVIGVGPKDLVFDPACGTGGFLISAMEAVRKSASPKYNYFKDHGLYGIEQRDDVYGLAMVNMIFRGDGNSHIYDGNCFDHSFWMRDNKVSYTLPGQPEPEGATKPFSRVLMNPPFKLESNPENEFVDYGLGELKKNGILFAVLPHIAIGGAKLIEWRRELLKRHTLLACIKFDKNLFYPVSEATYGLIIKGHIPHDKKNKVFFGCLFDDKSRQRKSKMISDHHMIDNVERMTSEVRRFMLGRPVGNDIPREQKTISINPKSVRDFSPESYLDTGATSINSFERANSVLVAKRRVKAVTTKDVDDVDVNYAVFPLSMLIQNECSPKVRAAKDYPVGTIPVISAQAGDNGINSWLDIPDELCDEYCITISKLHNTKPCQAFWHPYKFAVLQGKAIVLKPNQDLLDRDYAILYLCEAITSRNSWRYSYARSVKYHELEVELPVKTGGVDYDLMEAIARRQALD